MQAALEFLKPYAAAHARLAADSSAVEQGDVFVALAGSNRHGLDFLDDAIANGAAAVVHDGAREPACSVPSCAVPELGAQLGELASSFYGRPSESLRVVAVTGTKGKTTVAAWCAQLLGTPAEPCGYVGTLGAGASDSASFAIKRKLRLTTPNPMQLHGLLADFTAAGCTAAAIEASSHGLAQERLAGVACDVAVFTNFGTDHLDYHGTSADYLRAKLLLFERPELQAAVVNVDEHRSHEVRASASCPVLACGADPTCDLTWKLPGRQAAFSYKGESLSCELPAPGMHNASNLALALGAALQAGVAWDELGKRLASLRPVPGRLERIAAPGQAAVYVDFAHTSEALGAALEAVRAEHPYARLTCVFGCGGDRYRDKRPAMGAAACMRADRVIVTTDNPREEDPAQIIADVMAGCGAQAESVLDRRDAIIAAIAAAGPEDAILIAGKGDEDAIIGPGGMRTPFSDLEVARKLLVQEQDNV